MVSAGALSRSGHSTQCCRRCSHLLLQQRCEVLPKALLEVVSSRLPLFLLWTEDTCYHGHLSVLSITCTYRQDVHVVPGSSFSLKAGRRAAGPGGGREERGSSWKLSFSSASSWRLSLLCRVASSRTRRWPASTRAEGRMHNTFATFTKLHFHAYWTIAMFVSRFQLRASMWGWFKLRTRNDKRLHSTQNNFIGNRVQTDGEY